MRKRRSNQENQTPNSPAMISAADRSVLPQERKVSKEPSQSEKMTKSQTKTNNGKLIATKCCVK